MPNVVSPVRNGRGFFCFFRGVLAKRPSDFGVSEETNEKVTSPHLEKQAIVLHTLLFRMIQPVSVHPARLCLKYVAEETGQERV